MLIHLQIKQHNLLNTYSSVSDEKFQAIHIERKVEIIKDLIIDLYRFIRENRFGVVKNKVDNIYKLLEATVIVDDILQKFDVTKKDVVDSEAIILNEQLRHNVKLSLLLKSNRDVVGATIVHAAYMYQNYEIGQWLVGEFPLLALEPYGNRKYEIDPGTGLHLNEMPYTGIYTV